jgi:hypothetical protein
MDEAVLFLCRFHVILGLDYFKFGLLWLNCLLCQYNTARTLICGKLLLRKDWLSRAGTSPCSNYGIDWFNMRI